MPNNENKPKSKKGRIILGLILIIIGITVISYIVLIGLTSDWRDDDVSLNQVKNKSSENVVVLFFWGSGCQPCQEQKPVIEDLEKDYKNSNVTFYWFDASKHNDLTNHYNVNGVPTTIVLNQDGVYKKYEGFTEYDTLAKSIDNSINSYE